MSDIQKTALITGAARGIGRAVAIRLAKDGFHTVINYNGSVDAANDTVKECLKYNVKSIAIKADVANNDEVRDMVKEVQKEFGSIDCLVNNSGITKDNLLLRMSEDDFDKVIAVNLKGSYNTIKHITPIMLKQRSGSIINIASVVGITGNAGQANYAASKAGVIGLTKSVAKELSARGIRCNAVAPGYIQTEMTAVLSEEVLNNIMSMIPLNRPGKPEDVAALVSFLAGEESSYITGQVMNVDGGMVI